MRKYCPECDEPMIIVGTSNYGGFISMKLRCPSCYKLVEISNVD